MTNGLGGVRSKQLKRRAAVVASLKPREAWNSAMSIKPSLVILPLKSAYFSFKNTMSSSVTRFGSKSSQYRARRSEKKYEECFSAKSTYAWCAAEARPEKVVERA